MGFRPLFRRGYFTVVVFSAKMPGMICLSDRALTALLHSTKAASGRKFESVATCRRIVNSGADRMPFGDTAEFHSALQGFEAHTGSSVCVKLRRVQFPQP